MMPKISIRVATVNQICEAAALDLILCDSNEEFDQTFDDAIDNILILEMSRYVNPRQPLPKSDKWYTEILPEVDDSRFRHFMRVSRKDFAFILIQIEDHEGFHGTNSAQQFPIHKQLAITLYKLGMDGGGSSICNVAALFGVGDGGTIMKVVSRVLEALLAKETQWISWPSTAERKKIKEHMSDKLPGCIGYIDGSHIILDEAPIDDKESYYTRKQRYAIQIQAVCDNEKRIRNIYVGFPGSVHDARVFANSSIGCKPQNYLSEGEWLAGDSAYANTKFIVTPYKRNATNGSERQRKIFNRYFSGYRVNIECCFGHLKEVFQSLKGIRIRVDLDKHKQACDWFTACCILYNMILPSLEMDMSLFECSDEDEEAVNSIPFSEVDEQRSLTFNFLVNKLGL